MGRSCLPRSFQTFDLILDCVLLDVVRCFIARVVQRRHRDALWPIGSASRSVGARGPSTSRKLTGIRSQIHLGNSLSTVKRMIVKGSDYTAAAAAAACNPGNLNAIKILAVVSMQMS